jgi:hypothetical protein
LFCGGGQNVVRRLLRVLLLRRLSAMIPGNVAGGTHHSIAETTASISGSATQPRAAASAVGPDAVPQLLGSLPGDDADR